MTDSPTVAPDETPKRKRSVAARDIPRDPNLFSVAEAAKRMRCSESTLRRILDDPKQRKFRQAVVVMVGSRTRISKIRLEHWLHGERVAS